MLQPYVYLVEKQRNEPFQTWMDGLTLDNTPLLLYAQEHTQFNGILLPTWAWPLSRGIKIQNHDTKRQFLEYFSMLTQSKVQLQNVFPIDSTLDPLFMKEIEVAIKFDLAFFPRNITLNSKGANVGLGYKIRAF